MKHILADACIVGSGAAGAVVADELIERGLRVCVLEQGFPVGERTYSEVVRSAERAYLLTEDGWEHAAYPWSTCNLGGGTVFYGAAAFRFREIDFHCSPLVSGEDLDIDWPISYHDLAPYYDVLERRLGVSRSTSADPTAPPAMPPALPEHAPTMEACELFAAAQAQGLRPFATPLAIRSVDTAGGRRCDRRGPCIEHACRCAKADAVSIFWEGLQSNRKLNLLCGVKAIRLDGERSGRFNSVVATDVRTGQTMRVSAATFVLAANAAQSAAILLRSTSAKSPAGVGNEHGIVGRGLSVRPSVYIEARRTTRQRGAKGILSGPFSTFSLTDYYLSDACPDVLGGLIYEARPGKADHDWSPGSIRLECMIGDRPSFDNRVWIEDRAGRSVLHFNYRIDPRDARRLDFLAQRAISLLDEIGPWEYRIYRAAAERGTAHLAGTCRAGNDPRNAVVDLNGRVHGVENVYVADGGYMPFAGGVNPTLTIQANALRIARAVTMKRR